MEAEQAKVALGPGGEEKSAPEHVRAKDDEQKGELEEQEEGGEEQDGDEEKGQIEGKVDGDDLKCAICLDFLCVPVTTACQHTFCQGCLEQQRLNQLDIGAGAGGVGWLDDINSRNLLKCPTCRRMFPLIMLSVRNNFVERLVIQAVGQELYQARVDAANKRQLQHFIEREDKKRENHYRRQALQIPPLQIPEYPYLPVAAAGGGAGGGGAWYAHPAWGAAAAGAAPAGPALPIIERKCEKPGRCKRFVHALNDFIGLFVLVMVAVLCALLHQTLKLA